MTQNGQMIQGINVAVLNNILIEKFLNMEMKHIIQGNKNTYLDVGPKLPWGWNKLLWIGMYIHYNWYLVGFETLSVSYHSDVDVREIHNIIEGCESSK